MEQKEQMKALRKPCNTAGFSALVYYAILNAAVTFVLLIDAIGYVVRNLQNLDIDALIEYVLQSATTNGWGYVLAVLVGGLIILLWKKKEIYVQMFQPRQKMTFKVFLQILAVFVSAQALLQVFAPALEWLLNRIGLSSMAALEAASATADTFSMFLYLAIFAPLGEELLFRGLILRVLEPVGKRFAIIVSAVMFGLLHANIIQIPFGFLVGLVLGYVTVEYSIVWAIILHMINNFVLGDLLTRLYNVAPQLENVLFIALMIAAAVATVVILILRRKEVASYIRENKAETPCVKAFFTSPGILIFGILMLLMSLLSITKL